MNENLNPKLQPFILFIKHNIDKFDPRKNLNLHTLVYLLLAISYHLPIIYYQKGNVSGTMRAFTALGHVHAYEYEGSSILRIIFILATIIFFLFILFLPVILYVNHVMEKYRKTGHHSLCNLILSLIYLGCYQYMLTQYTWVVDFTLNSIILLLLIYFSALLNYLMFEKYKGFQWKSSNKNNDAFVMNEKRKKKQMLYILISMVSFFVPIAARDVTVKRNFFFVLSRDSINVSFHGLSKGIEYEQEYEGIFEHGIDVVSTLTTPITYAFFLLPVIIFICFLYINKKNEKNVRLLNLNVLFSATYVELLIIQMLGLHKALSLNVFAYIIVLNSVLLFKECIFAAKAKYIMSDLNEQEEASNDDSPVVVEKTDTEVFEDFTKVTYNEPEHQKEQHNNSEQKCFCIMCGAPIMEGGSFCTECGYKVKDDVYED